VHQVGPKDYGSQHFSFLALKAEPVGEVQILRASTATARDQRVMMKKPENLYFEILFNGPRP
jgi:hypothetical protein